MQAGLDEMRRLLAQGGGGTGGGGGSAATQGVYDTLADLIASAAFLSLGDVVRTNAHISGFTFYPYSAQMHNTQFKNTMIYIWGSYNVEVEMQVSYRVRTEIS